MVKILYLITDLNIGGTEKMLYEITTRINKDKYIPVVVSLKKFGACALALKEKNIQIEVMDLYKNLFLAPFKFFFVIFYLVKLIKREKIQLINSFLFQANILGKIVCFISNVPLITSIRVVEQQKKWHLTIEKISKNLSKCIVVNSIALKKFIQEKLKLNENKIVVIYNGIDAVNVPHVSRTDYFKDLNLTECDVLVATVGRLHIQKGIKYLIEAVNLFNKSHSAGLKRIKFLIIGDGQERYTLEKMVKDYNLSHLIQFAGWRKDSFNIISISDIFILPSLWEGTPNTILEAMCCAKPVIAANVGGVSELINDGENGLLVPPGDSAALNEKIMLLINNAELQKKLGSNALKSVKEKFPMNRMVNQFENLYDSYLLFK